MIHPPTSIYTGIIQQACSCTIEDALVIEELIRAEIPTLDHLSRSRLEREARGAQKDMRLLAEIDPEVLALYRRQAGVPS